MHFVNFTTLRDAPDKEKPAPPRVGAG